MNTFAATPVLALCFLAFFISPFFGRVLFEAEKDIGSTKSGPETGPSHGDRDRMSEALRLSFASRLPPFTAWFTLGKKEHFSVILSVIQITRLLNLLNHSQISPCRDRQKSPNLSNSGLWGTASRHSVVRAAPMDARSCCRDQPCGYLSSNSNNLWMQAAFFCHVVSQFRNKTQGMGVPLDIQHHPQGTSDQLLNKSSKIGDL